MLLDAPANLKSLAPTIGILELVLDRSPAPVIAVAGASGKSTTAKLVTAMLRASGFGVAHGLREALAALNTLTEDDRVVVELSPAVAVAPHAGPAILAVTGMADDELPPGQTYLRAARGLRPTVAATRDTVVINADDRRAVALAKSASARVRRASTRNAGADATVVDGALVVRVPATGMPMGICHIADTALGASSLTADLLVAAATAIAAGADPGALEAVIRRAAPDPDCFEVVAVRGGVRWVSDARATRPGRSAATLAALDGPVLLIAGGQAGGQPLDNWAGQAGVRASHVLLFGPADEGLAAAVGVNGHGPTIVRCADLDDAVIAAAHLAHRGDTVLFSPGCEPVSPQRPTPAERFRDLATMPRATRAEAA